MPSESTARAIGAVVIAGAIVFSVVAAGSVGTADLADRNTFHEPRATAIPPTPGFDATHSVIAGTAATPNDTALTGILLEYERGANVSLAGVPPDQVRATVLRNVTRDFGRDELHPTNVTVANRTVRVRFAGNVTLHGDDTVAIRVRGVRNPPTQGRVNVTATINPDGPNRSQARAAIEIYQPAPELSNQGRVGEYHRIAVKWPTGVSGFLVTKTETEKIVGVQHHDPDSTYYMDIPLPRLVGDDVEKPATITVAAYNDTDGNGAFDPNVDRPFQRDGENVSITVENALVTTTTTTTTATPTTSTSTSTTQATTPTSRTTAPAQNAPVAGFSIGIALVALAAATLLLWRK